MCGIAGIIDFGGRPVASEALAHANAAMRHRGPDDAGTWQGPFGPRAAHQPTLGLAVVRLAVLDPTPAGHQPFLYDDDRYLLAYNGEVYNFRSLRRELAADGWAFRTETDTETVAATLAAWGPAGLARLEGMWALAWFDTHTGIGLLARDERGIKPLLTARSAGRLYFASEMGALSALGTWDRTIDQAALVRYLSVGYFAAPRSVYASAGRLSPGSFIACAPDGAADAQPWGVESVCESATPTYSEACTAVRHRLERAVALRRRADVPLGAFLSGGLDSAIIATHLAACTPGRIQTFSIGFAGNAGYDESHHALQMARHLDSDHHALRVNGDDLTDALPDALDRLAEPFADASILPTLLVARLARAHVTVSLSGDGGDELFGGYWRYLGHAALAAYQAWPAFVRRGLVEPLARRMASAKSSPLGNRVRQFHKLLRVQTQSALGRHAAWSRIMSPEGRRVLHTSVREQETALVASAGNGQEADADALNAILAFDLRESLPSDMLHKVDLASMAASLEVRVPFLDRELVRYVERLPSRYKIDRGVRKRLLVDAYRGIVPDTVLDRAKMGFEAPVGELLRDAWRPLFRDMVTPRLCDELAILDYAGVEQVYAAHCARRAEHGDLLFALLSLGWWWHRQKQDAASGPATASRL